MDKISETYIVPITVEECDGECSKYRKIHKLFGRCAYFIEIDNQLLKLTPLEINELLTLGTIKDFDIWKKR